MSSSKEAVAIVKYLVASKEPQKLTEISKTLEISGSTAHRILSALKELEWVAQDSETKKYKTGIGLLELALALIAQLDLKTVAIPIAEALNRKINEGVTVSARVGLERIYIHHLQSDHELQQVVNWGKRLPLWAGAAGKAILAYLPEQEIEKALSGLRESGVTFYSSGRPIREEKLRDELVEIRRQGFAVSNAERTAGTCSAAAPVFGGGGVIGSVSVGGPELRFDLDLATRSGPMVREAAENISLQMGVACNSMTQALKRR